MSWDALIMKLKTPGVPVAEVTSAACLEALGDEEAIRAAVDSVIPGVVWTHHGTWGHVRVCEVWLEFNIRNPAGGTFMIHARGGDPIPPVVALCRAFGWSALDVQIGKWIDLEHPSREGWERFERARETYLAELKRNGQA